MSAHVSSHAELRIGEIKLEHHWRRRWKLTAVAREGVVRRVIAEKELLLHIANLMAQGRFLDSPCTRVLMHTKSTVIPGLDGKRHRIKIFEPVRVTRNGEAVLRVIEGGAR